MENFSHNNQTIAIFGAADGWGKKMAEIAEHLQMRVIKIDPELGPETCDSRKAVEQADIIFLAAPDTKIRKILEETRDLLKGKIVLDCATSKSDFEDILIEISEKNSVCSTHQMVNPETPASGQNVLIMPVGAQSGPAQKVATDLFEAVRMKIHTDISFTEHRRMMAVMQFLPHLVQRMMIATAGTTLQKMGKNIEEVSECGPANFHMTELAMGRVAMQKPETSAGILIDGLQTEFGKEIVALLRQSLKTIEQSSDDRPGLTELLTSDRDRIDAGTSWSKDQKATTSTILERRGNLRARSCSIESPEDAPGTLLKICEIFKQHNINMTAMDSHVTQDLGPRRVRFDIGIGDEAVDWNLLDSELQVKGLTLQRIKKQ